MTEPQKTDIWAGGSAYERYVGRWSRLVAAPFLAWLDVPPGSAWLDVGAGTGILSREILARCAPASLVGVDPSEGFLAHAREAVDDKRAGFRIGDARALPVDDASVDVAVAGLVINFVPDQPKAAAGMRRAVRAGGMVAAYVWDYAGEMQLMRRFWDAAAAENPAARDRDETLRFPVCRPDGLRDLFAAAGLRAIETRAIDVPTVFAGFDDYWSPFLGGTGPAPAYCMSLAEDARAALRERLRATLPTAPDGTIPLIARAFAAKGVV